MNIIAPPRNLCKDCWTNIYYGVCLRTNLNIIPDVVIRALSEFYSSRRNNDGSSVAIRESPWNRQPTDEERLLIALFCILDSFSLSSLMSWLDNHGLSQLSDVFCVHHTFGLVVPVLYSRFHETRRLQQFYYVLKSFFDNNIITVENRFLENFFIWTKRKFRHERDTDLLFRANKFALITWLRIQQCKRDTRQIRRVLNTCFRFWPRGVDKTLLDAVYHSKMAVADALDGKEESAIYNMHIANNRTLLINDPITVLLYHDRRYVYQLLGKRDCQLGASKRGLEILYSGDQEANNCDYVVQMKRMFLLYSTQHHLAIENDLKINDNVIPSAVDLAEAAGTIQCFEESLSCGVDIEPRRMMIYDVCKARFLEWSDPVRSKSFLEYALLCTEKGAKFGREKQNIEEFLEKIRNRLNQSR